MPNILKSAPAHPLARAQLLKLIANSAVAKAATGSTRQQIDALRGASAQG